LLNALVGTTLATEEVVDAIADIET